MTQPQTFADKTRHIHKRIDKVENNVDILKQQSIRNETEITYIKRNIDTIQSDTTFLRRTITGALITAVVSGIITGVGFLLNHYIAGGL